jgi:3-hydroxyisobutyrate dehydrogenase
MLHALFAVQVATMAELLAALRGTGIDLAGAVNAVASTPVASPAASAAATGILDRAFSAAFPVELVVKDLEYALEDAKSRAADLPVIRAATARCTLVAEHGHGNDNITGVAKAS